MKKWLIYISLFIIIISLSIMGGFFFFSKNIDNNIDDMGNIEELAINDESSHSYTNDLELTVTSYSGFKISPNTQVRFETYYKKCNHKDVQEETANTDIVNLNEEELQEKYKDYTIKQFGAEEVVLYNEVEGYCNQHYVIKEKEGRIGVFKLNTDGEEELVKLTDISIQYLPETDLVSIRNGIKVYGQEEMNKFLEDYE